MENHRRNSGMDSDETGIALDSRRSFLKKAGAATITIGSGLALPGLTSESPETLPGEESPWYRKVTRWGQTNITEIDPSSYDIQWWRGYWKKTRIGGIIINAGGIVAYYPSKIPLHRQAQHLQGRDLFGDLCKYAHEDGLAVFARMDSNRAHSDFYDAHPGWFAVDASGKPYKAGEMFVTCINGPYYNEHMPAVIKEVAGLYHPEGFTDNSWSGLGRDSICYCENCRKNFHEKYQMEIPREANWGDKAYRQWIVWNYERRLEVWDLNNRTSKAAGGKDCIWSGMNSGSVSGQSRSFRDYKEICKRAEIIMLDSQARNDSDGFQQNAITGKLIHGLLGWEKLVPESMAMYQAGRPTFRLAAKPVNEARMWMYEGIAGGIQPWWHHVGAYHEDRRMYETASPVMAWHETNEEFLTDRIPVAGAGLVWSQGNMDFFGRDTAEQLVELPWRGMAQALIRAGIPFLPVNADHISRDAEQLSLLILPNLGSMTGDQVKSIKQFVRGGGSLIATGVSSLYDQWGDPLPDFALGDIFGVHMKGKANALTDETARAQFTDTLHTYLRILPGLRRGTEGPHNSSEPALSGSRHPLLKGFEQTDIMPFGGALNSLITESDAEVLMTFIPAFPIYPPETAWMRTPETNIPGLIVRTLKEASRIAFMPADIDRQFGRFNLPDHGNLLGNIIRWALNDKAPIVVDAKGLIDCQIYRQKGRLVIHLVNLTNSGTWRQPLDELIPVGPVKIKVRTTEETPGRRVRLLVSGRKTDTVVLDGWSSFEIDQIVDHEVAVLY